MRCVRSIDVFFFGKVCEIKINSLSLQRLLMFCADFGAVNVFTKPYSQDAHAEKGWEFESRYILERRSCKGQALMRESLTLCT